MEGVVFSLLDRDIFLRYAEYMDGTQVIFLLIAVALTVLLITLGVQVYFILREVRMVVAKMNRLLDDIDSVTSTVRNGVDRLSSLANGFKMGSLLLSLFNSVRKREARD